jgi:PPIC-type PPIASE domain
MLVKFLKDPLAHFLVFGLGLFLVFNALNPSSNIEDPKLITVDRDALLTFFQYRAKAFQRDVAATQLAAMSEKQLGQLVDDYVREEALYREARSLGLAQNDYIIKRRMIQKIDFIAQGFADAAVTLDDKEIKAHYEANRERYREQAIITFTHIFYSIEQRKLEEAKALASTKLAELSSGRVPFTDAPKHGERFPYGVNYVERTRDHVESHFGASMTDALFALDPDDKAWRGPFTSSYGVHLVMAVAMTEARIPPLEELRSRVEADLRSKRRNEQMEKAIKTIVDTYRVKMNLKGENVARIGGQERP